MDGAAIWGEIRDREVFTGSLSLGFGGKKFLGGHVNILSFKINRNTRFMGTYGSWWPKESTQ